MNSMRAGATRQYLRRVWTTQKITILLKMNNFAKAKKMNEREENTLKICAFLLFLKREIA